MLGREHFVTADSYGWLRVHTLAENSVVLWSDVVHRGHPWGMAVVEDHLLVSSESGLLRVDPDTERLRVCGAAAEAKRVRVDFGLSDLRW